MSNGQIVENIYKSGNYKALCRTIAKRQDLSEELYSEFISSLLEMDPEKLSRLSKEPFFDVFCVGVINNIWNKRNRVKIYKVGSTSPLFMFSSTYELKGDNDLNLIKSTPKYNYKIDYVSSDVKKILFKDWNHEDIEKLFQSRVFYYSYVVHGNPLKFSKKTGIPVHVIRRAIKNVKETIKSKLKTKLYD